MPDAPPTFTELELKDLERLTRSILYTSPQKLDLVGAARVEGDEYAWIPRTSGSRARHICSVSKHIIRGVAVFYVWPPDELKQDIKRDLEWLPALDLCRQHILSVARPLPQQ